MRIRGAALVVAWLVLVGPARADRTSEARVRYEKATAHFAVGEFAEAADHYQAAYKLKPDAALLYNAAQAYRLAGKHDKALVLYRNYLQLYPKAENTDEIREQIAKLKQAIAASQTASTSPPTGTKPASEAPPSASPPPPEPAPPSAEPAPAPAAPTTRSAERRPFYKQWWLWTIVGVVAAGGAVTAGVLATQPGGRWANHEDVGPGTMTQAVLAW